MLGASLCPKNQRTILETGIHQERRWANIRNYGSQGLNGSFLLAGLDVSFYRAVGFLRGILVVVVILVKGHAFLAMVRSTVGCDPLALVNNFTPVEENIGLLETRFDVDAVFMIVCPEDVTGSVNLTLLSLFFGIIVTNFPSVLLILGQVLLLFVITHEYSLVYLQAESEV
ncbi:hypothetical protein Tco_0646078 [Tanacetum coccineum]